MSPATVGCYPPVARKENLDRLAAFLPSSKPERDLWTEIHEEVQEQLAALDREVHQRLVGVRVDAGRTHGASFFLHSYLTFSMAESGLDPVVVGVTFGPVGPGVALDADVSGEQTGDLIFDLPSTTVEHSREALLSAARESAQRLCLSADGIVAALKDPSRSVE